jgi:hypothetical protein
MYRSVLAGNRPQRVFTYPCTCVHIHKQYIYMSNYMYKSIELHLCTNRTSWTYMSNFMYIHAELHVHTCRTSCTYMSNFMYMSNFKYIFNFMCMSKYLFMSKFLYMSNIKHMMSLWCNASCCQNSRCRTRYICSKSCIKSPLHNFPFCGSLLYISHTSKMAACRMHGSMAHTFFGIPVPVQSNSMEIEKQVFLRLEPNRVARFFLVHDTKDGKMYQMNTKCTNGS